MTQNQCRRHGLSSRLRPLVGPRTPWTSPDGAVVDLPVVFDLVMTDPETEIEAWRVEATVGIRLGDPALLQMVVTCGPAGGGLDPTFLQREFRWATPVEAVTRLVPLIVKAGKDPYATEFPAQGYPEVTRRAQPTSLSDQFLEDIAGEYLVLGRGYAKSLAAKYSVAPRTVVSWVEKARERGILSQTSSGRTGGRIVPTAQRTPAASGGS